MNINLPYNFNLRSYQDPLWQAMVVNNMRRALTVWPRRNGKDLTAVNVLTAKAIQRPGLYLYIAPFHNQVRLIIWQGSDGSGKKFLSYIPPEIIERKLDSTMEITLKNNSIIKLVGSDNIDSIVGTNPIGIVYTEFSLQKPDAWGYMRPILAENGGWAVFNGTPRGLNHFYQMARMAEKNPSWFYQYLTRDDTGVPTLEAIEEDRQAGMPESLIQQEYYCNWTASQEEVFIPLDIVSPCVGQPFTAQDHAPKIMGVDVAYAAKGDRAVIARRQGRNLYPLEAHQGMDNMAFASRVARHIREWGPHAVFIDAGRGEGVISRLFQMGHEDTVIPVHFGGKTYDELYANKKAEMWGRARQWFLDDPHPSIPDDEALVKDLTTPFFEMDEKNKLKIESKKAMRTRGESSPDLADALILTFAEEISHDVVEYEKIKKLGVDPDVAAELFSGMYGQSQNYNPLTYMDDITTTDEKYSFFD